MEYLLIAFVCFFIVWEWIESVKADRARQEAMREEDERAAAISPQPGVSGEEKG
jgi:large-conductance mechanosensitive channel